MPCFPWRKKDEVREAADFPVPPQGQGNKENGQAEDGEEIHDPAPLEASDTDMPRPHGGSMSVGPDPEEHEEDHAPPPVAMQKPLSAKAAGKVCYYLVSHFFGRSMQYKPELLRLSDQVGDLRIISSIKLKTFLDGSRIMVPDNKMPAIARYYSPGLSPRSSAAFLMSQGDTEEASMQSEAILMDVDHLLLDLDKAAMRYYLNKNTQDDDVKPTANVDISKITELVFAMLVEDPAFANREISDEEEIRIEELIKSVDMSTVCIPIGTRARMVKANLTAGSSLSKSSTKGSMFEKLSKTLSKRVGKEMEKEEDKDKEKTDQEKAEDDSQLVFDVPSWSLRAMQARQGERNAHLQVQKGATSLSTPQSQAIQNTLRKRSLMQQQEILAHAISGAVKAVILADGKGAEGKDGAGDQSTKGNNSEGSPATHNSASLPPVSSMKPAMKKKGSMQRGKSQLAGASGIPNEVPSLQGSPVASGPAATEETRNSASEIAPQQQGGVGGHDRIGGDSPSHTDEASLPLGTSLPSTNSLRAGKGSSQETAYAPLMQ